MSEASRAWSWRHAFASSSLPATTKHVLHTLGMFMNELGEGCYPSVADICRYNGLDKKTVLKHLAGARDAGWIGVSQHGYRGQKWKRQEYAARWPERDLVAPCPPCADEQGGGVVPPPFDAENVVESAPEGGGTEGSKVVEQVHQDKTSPENTPNTSPVEREAREGERDRNDPKEVERWLKRNHPRWPSYVADSGREAMKAAMALTPEEREQAADRLPYYLAAEREQKGKCAFSVYLAEKRWERLPPRQAEPDKPAYAPPFGPVWSAIRMRDLLTGPKAATPLKGWEERAIEAGALDRETAERSSRQNNGWPAVNVMHAKAAQRGVGVTGHSEADVFLGRLTEFVPVTSEAWKAWKAEHERRGWPWLPDPGRGAYFPAGGPDGLEAFEAAIRGNQDDAGGREAAE